mgnify:CR=1 FL=1
MSLSKNWVLQIDPEVLKTLKKFPQKDSKRIVTVIESLPANPYSGDIQKMKGEENVWRRRIGSYRLFYEIFAEEKIIHVYHVERRTTQTY